MAFFSHYSHWVSSPFIQVFLTSVSKDDFFFCISVVDSNKSYSGASVVVHSQFSKYGFQCGSNILSLTYKVKIDYLACSFYFHNSDHVGSQENLSFVFLLVNRHANASG